MAEFAFQYWQRVDELLCGMSLKQLADKTGLSYATIKDMRTRSRYPRQEASIKIASALNTTTDYLMTGRGAARGEESDVAGYLEGNAEAKAIVKAMMDNPGLTEHLAAILKMMGK